MVLLINLLVAIIALEHLWFLFIEMFLWTKPLGRKIFKLDPDFAQKSASLAANQGLYNGFLSAGLLWSLCTSSEEFALSLKVFFLSCVLVAGLYGAYSVGKTILWVQALPAALTLALIYFLY